MDNYHILLVDDDREIVKSLGKLLELEGYGGSGPSDDGRDPSYPAGRNDAETQRPFSSDEDPGEK